MINSLSGTVSGVDGAMLLLETDGGIEWSLQISGKTAEALPGIGDPVRILTYLHHRDDQMVLYGFLTSDERTVFHDLLRVGGIGPRQALRHSPWLFASFVDAPRRGSSCASLRVSTSGLAGGARRC